MIVIAKLLESEGSRTLAHIEEVGTVIELREAPLLRLGHRGTVFASRSITVVEEGYGYRTMGEEEEVVRVGRGVLSSFFGGDPPCFQPCLSSLALFS